MKMNGLKKAAKILKIIGGIGYSLWAAYFSYLFLIVVIIKAFSYVGLLMLIFILLSLSSFVLLCIRGLNRNYLVASFIVTHMIFYMISPLDYAISEYAFFLIIGLLDQPWVLWFVGFIECLKYIAMLFVLAIVVKHLAKGRSKQ